jgi:hypothetical protein
MLLTAALISSKDPKSVSSGQYSALNITPNNWRHWRELAYEIRRNIRKPSGRVG